MPNASGWGIDSITAPVSFRAVSNVVNLLAICVPEATGNRDSATTDEILAIFDALNEEGRTLIMVTHEDDVAERAKRIIRLKDGRLHTDERISEERRNAAREAQRAAVAEMMARE